MHRFVQFISVAIFPSVVECQCTEWRQKCQFSPTRATNRLPQQRPLSELSQFESFIMKPTLTFYISWMFGEDQSRYFVGKIGNVRILAMHMCHKISGVTRPKFTKCLSDVEKSSSTLTQQPKYTTFHLTLPILLEILASSLTYILFSLTKLHLSQKPVTITFVNFAIPALPWFVNCLYHCYLYRPLLTWLL